MNLELKAEDMFDSLEKEEEVHLENIKVEGGSFQKILDAYHALIAINTTSLDFYNPPKYEYHGREKKIFKLCLKSIPKYIKKKGY